MTTWQRGDIVGGGADIPAGERCYYWRDEHGAWASFPDLPGENEQDYRSDCQIETFIARGQLIRYPVAVHGASESARALIDASNHVAEVGMGEIAEDAFRAWLVARALKIGRDR